MSQDIPDALLDTPTGRQAMAEVEEVRAAAEEAKLARVTKWNEDLRKHAEEYVAIRARIVEQARAMEDLFEDLFSRRCDLDECYVALYSLGIVAKVPRRVRYRTDETYDEVKQIVEHLSDRLLCA